jgi:protoporphyrin/coproporphyrin ferrochelatase
MQKKAVLLLQMGGPNSTDLVETFLFNLFKDRYIIQLPFFLRPFQSFLARIISKKRAPEVAKQYALIGGKSPILFETRAQAQALEKKTGLKTFVAMRYSSPFLKETFEEIKKTEPDELVVIPLYPQFSVATSGSSIFECRELFSKTGFDKKTKITYKGSWYKNVFFIELIAKRIHHQIRVLENQGLLSILKTVILFSAHGLPVKYVERGDPYQKQVIETVQLVMKKFKELDGREFSYDLCYQSRVGPVKWLEPSTEQAIEKLAREGIENLIVVPVSFVGDHIETLFEIGVTYKNLAESLGIKNFLLTRPPKANPLFIQGLESLTYESTSLFTRSSRD